MIIKHLEDGGSFLFKAGPRRKTKFRYIFGDLSTYGNTVKKPIKVRGNYRKSMKLLLENELNEFNINVQDGEYHEVHDPVLSLGRSAETAKELRKMYRSKKFKAEPSKLDVTITLPAGNAIKVYSTKDALEAYIVNDGEKIFLTEDFKLVDDITGEIV